jgi:hypothetical protein
MYCLDVEQEWAQRAAQRAFNGIPTQRARRYT